MPNKEKLALSALSKGGIVPNWAKWTLSGQSWHYPRVELDQIWQSGHYLGKVGTTQGWFWVPLGQSGHYLGYLGVQGTLSGRTGGTIWGPLGLKCVLGRPLVALGRPLGDPWTPSGRPWASFGRPWASCGAPWVPCGGPWAPCGAKVGPEVAKVAKVCNRRRI